MIYFYSSFTRASLMARSPYSFSLILMSSCTVSSRLIFGLFFTFCAFYPKRRVEIVSAKCISWGEQVTIRVVFELPPKDSLRSLVNLELRYGTWPFPPRLSDKAFITVPKLVKLRLIFLAYSSTFPSAPVFDIFSLPARSMRKRRLVLEGPSGRAVCERVSWKSRWEREECSFILVAQVMRFLCPWAISALS